MFKCTMLAALAMLACGLIAAPAPVPAPKKVPTDRDYRELLRQSLTDKSFVGGVPPFADRAAWAKLAGEPNAVKAIERADARLKEKIEPIPDELYLEYYQSGNRDNYQKAYGRLSGAANDFALAYLATGDKKYLAKLEEALGVILQMKSWMLPAHDRNHETFDGKGNRIELVSSLNSWKYAVIYALLKDELKPEIAAELKKQLYRRTLIPIRAMLDGSVTPDWWLVGTNNWNAVCWAGVLGTVLAIEDDREAKINLVDAATRHIGYSLIGFSPDGYCSEGMGYWNYGYGHNLRFAAMLRLATGGKINLMDLAEMRRPGEFPEKITIVGDVVPAYADCSLDAKPSPTFLGLRDYLLDRPTANWKNLRPGGTIEDFALFAAVPAPEGKLEETSGVGGTSLFDESGIVVVRPLTPENRVAASFKGGSNFELHNHNDVGSYAVVVDGVPMLFDPGSEVYTARTFSAKRYESKLLNSFGHPVPVIDGKLQKPGKGTYAPILSTLDHEREFVRSYDIAPAYQLPEISKLVRTFRYSRLAPGSFSVTDEGEFRKEVTFETALLTPGVFTATGNDSGRITYKGKSVNIKIDSSAPFEFVIGEIKEKVNHKETITRIGLRFRAPVSSARVTVTFTP
ncbi:MAG: heparinase II/III family protein [Victivallaceae bacterium]